MKTTTLTFNSLRDALAVKAAAERLGDKVYVTRLDNGKWAVVMYCPNFRD